MAVCFFGTLEYMRLRPRALVRFEAGLRQRLHARCRKSVAKFRTSLFEVLTLLLVSEAALILLSEAEAFPG